MSEISTHAPTRFVFSSPAPLTRSDRIIAAQLLGNAIHTTDGLLSGTLPLATLDKLRGVDRRYINIAERLQKLRAIDFGFIDSDASETALIPLLYEWQIQLGAATIHFNMSGKLWDHRDALCHLFLDFASGLTGHHKQQFASAQFSFSSTPLQPLDVRLLTAFISHATHIASQRGHSVLKAADQVIVDQLLQEARVPRNAQRTLAHRLFTLADQVVNLDGDEDGKGFTFFEWMVIERDVIHYELSQSLFEAATGQQMTVGLEQKAQIIAWLPVLSEATRR